MQVLEALSRRPFAVVGHRGAAGLRTENTIASVREAIRLGVDAVEVDVRSTADGALVVHHDEDLRRLFNVPRKVRELTLSEIRSLRAGEEGVPTLQEVMSEVSGKVGLLVEVKEPQDAPAVVRAIKEEGASEWAAVISFHPEAVGEASRAGLISGLIYSRPPGEIVQAHRLGARLVLPIHTLATASAVGLAHRMRLKVVAWTVNQPNQALELSTRGVDAIATDRPDLILRVRRQAPGVV